MSAAFGVCEALFTANPEAIADEGDSGHAITITVPGGRLATAGTRIRLVRHDMLTRRFYCLFPEDNGLSILMFDRDDWVPEEIARELAASVVVPVDGGR